MQKKLWLMGMLATVLLVGGAANAYWGECTNLNYYELETPPGTYNYRINFDTFSEQGCSDEEAIVFAAASAGDAWNSEAGATSFQYTGATTNENWSSAFGCWWLDRQYSTIGAWDISSMGLIYGDCCVVPFIDCSEVFIQIDADRFSGDDKWRKMARTITHEMGHAADLGHPTSDEFSIMNSQANNNIPHLRQWEIKCAEVNEASRDLNAYAKIQLSTGIFYPYTYSLVDSDFDIVRAVVDYHGQWNLAYQAGVWPLLWLPDWGAEALCILGYFMSDYWGSGPAIVRWPEIDPENDYVVVSKYGDAFGMGDGCFGHQATFFSIKR